MNARKYLNMNIMLLPLCILSTSCSQSKSDFELLCETKIKSQTSTADISSFRVLDSEDVTRVRKDWDIYQPQSITKIAECKLSKSECDDQLIKQLMTLSAVEQCLLAKPGECASLKVNGTLALCSIGQDKEKVTWWFYPGEL